MTSVVEHLSNLIRIPSVSNLSNRPIIDYVVCSLRAAGWSTQELAYRDAAGTEKLNLIAAPPGQKIADRAVDLAFICHTDTVPYSADWQGALQPSIVDGELRGCGACDVKGFLACLLSAAGEVAMAPCSGSVRIILTADEEIGCIGAAHLLAADVVSPRRVVIGEPTSLHAARAGKGYCLAKITVTGREAHSAHPEKGASAIYAAARLLTAIEQFSEELQAEQHSFFTPGFTTLNVGTVHGGSAKNIVPGQCEFLVEWRPIPGQAPGCGPAGLKEIADRQRLQHPGIEYAVSILRQQAGFETGADASLVRDIERLTSRAATSIPFGSEAGLLSSIAEEVVVFGPGDMRSAHSSRECVPVAELEQAVAVIHALMTAP